MSSKIKYILVFLLTIIMASAVKYGKVNESYYEDLQIEKYCNKIDKIILEIESFSAREEVSDEDLQEKINNGRLVVDEAKNYLNSKDNVIIEEIVPRWSERLDKVQQIILNNIEDKIKKYNYNLESVLEIIPENLPENWKEYYNLKVN